MRETLQLRLRELHLAGQDINKISRIACQAADRLDALEAECAALKVKEAIWEAETAEARRQSSLIVKEREKTAKRISELEEALRAFMETYDVDGRVPAPEWLVKRGIADCWTLARKALGVQS